MLPLKGPGDSLSSVVLSSTLNHINIGYIVLFRQYDTDGSGAIDEQEFRELVKSINDAAPMFPGNFARALQEFDA